MTMSATARSDATLQVANAWQRQISLRRLYTILGIGLLLAATLSSMWFADEANAGHFWDRLPHILDFLSWLIPKDWNDVWRAVFDIASPHDTGTQEFNFPLGRVYVWGGFYIPEYFELMLTTLNVALVSTFIGFIFAVPFSFIAARNLTPHPVLRLVVKRFMELLRAFPRSSSPVCSQPSSRPARSPPSSPSACIRSVRWESCSTRSTRTSTCVPRKA